jgi:hypothetical protein
LTLTTAPFCWAERDSRMENTPPPTDTSRHRPHFASPPQKGPRGCMMRTPFVVRPSISRFSCHFVAFSCKEQFKVIQTPTTRMYTVSPFQNVYTEILTPHYAVR